MEAKSLEPWGERETAGAVSEAALGLGGGVR